MAAAWLALAALAPPAVVWLAVIVNAVAWAGPAALLRALGDPSALSAAALSAVTAAVSAALSVAAAAPAAYALSRSAFPGRALVSALLTAPLAAPPVAVGFLLLLFFASNPLGRAIDSTLGVVFSPGGIVAAQTAITFPIALRLLWEVFDAVDRGYEDVARSLGCGTLCRVTRVVLPMAWRGLAASYAVCFARAMGEFGATIVLAGAIPGRTETLPAAIYMAFEGGEPELAVALSLLSLAVAVAVLALHASLGGPRWAR